MVASVDTDSFLIREIHDCGLFVDHLLSPSAIIYDKELNEIHKNIPQDLSLIEGLDTKATASLNELS